MKRNVRNMLRVVSGLAIALVLTVGVANAQLAPALKPSPEPTKSPDARKTAKKAAETTSETVGDGLGDYIVTSSIEFGYRGQRVVGDDNKFRSDLNYKAGPRLFDSSFLMRSKDGNGGLFDILLVTATGWGADASGQMRISMEKPTWYRFEGSYRRFKYFRYLNNIVNPNYLFTGFPVPPNPAVGLHSYNTKTELGDFDLTILPKNDSAIRLSVSTAHSFRPTTLAEMSFNCFQISGPGPTIFVSGLRASSGQSTSRSCKASGGSGMIALSTRRPHSLTLTLQTSLALRHSTAMSQLAAALNTPDSACIRSRPGS